MRVLALLSTALLTACGSDLTELVIDQWDELLAGLEVVLGKGDEQAGGRCG